MFLRERRAPPGAWDALSDRIVERRAELAAALKREAVLCQALLNPKVATARREETPA